MQSSWIGKGVVIPVRPSTATRSGEMPSAENVGAAKAAVSSLRMVASSVAIMLVIETNPFWLLVFVVHNEYE
jgi:hypothetical protein